MNQINKNNITEETYDALFELEVLGIKIIDIYNKIKDPNHFNRKEIDSLKERALSFIDYIIREKDSVHLQLERATDSPILNLYYSLLFL